MKVRFLLFAICFILLMGLSVQAQYTEKWTVDSRAQIFLDAGNTDGDPQQEFLYGYPSSSQLDTLVLIDGLTGAVEWTYVDEHIEMGIYSRINSSTPLEAAIGPHLADVDADGADEILFATYSSFAGYKLRCYDAGVAVGVEENLNTLPESIELGQNYPNPFNPATTIEYSVPKKSHVTIKIYNILGQQLATLVDEEKPVGDYSVIWDGKSKEGTPVSSGVYFYALRTDEVMDSRKMLLLK